MILHELQRSKNKIIIQLKYSTIVVNIYCIFQNFHYIIHKLKNVKERERERSVRKENGDRYFTKHGLYVGSILSGLKLPP